MRSCEAFSSLCALKYCFNYTLGRSTYALNKWWLEDNFPFFFYFPIRAFALSNFGDANFKLCWNCSGLWWLLRSSTMVSCSGCLGQWETVLPRELLLIRRCNINCTQRKVDRDVYRPPTKRQNALRAPTGKTETSSYLTFEWPVVRFLGLCPKWCRVTSPADTTLNKGSSSYYFGWRPGWWKIASLTQEDVFLQQPGRNGWGEMRFIIHPENAYAVIT